MAAHLPTKLASANASSALKAVKENVDPAGQQRREADDESLDSYEGSTTEDEEDEELEDDDEEETDVESNPPGTELPIQSLPPSPPLNRTPMSKVNYKKWKFFRQSPTRNSATNGPFVMF